MKERRECQAYMGNMEFFQKKVLKNFVVLNIMLTFVVG